MKKKIIIFIPSIEDGGVEKNLFVISNYLHANNFAVEILTCNYDKSKNFSKGIKFIGNNISSDVFFSIMPFICIFLERRG